MTKKGKWVLKNGKWEEGSAAPRLLREDLRKLPGDAVTDDMDDDDRVHELDDEHIRDDLVDQWHEKQMAEDGPKTLEDELPKLSVAQVGERVPLNQWEIDVVRVRVMKSLVDSYVAQIGLGRDPDMGVKHLWFPENNVNHYELRSGNPPSNKNRPKHLKGYRIEIDIFKWPKRFKDVLAERGVELPDLKEGMT